MGQADHQYQAMSSAAGRIGSSLPRDARVTDIAACNAFVPATSIRSQTGVQNIIRASRDVVAASGLESGRITMSIGAHVDGPRLAARSRDLVAVPRAFLSDQRPADIHSAWRRDDHYPVTDRPRAP